MFLSIFVFVVLLLTPSLHSLDQEVLQIVDRYRMPSYDHENDFIEVILEYTSKDEGVVTDTAQYKAFLNPQNQAFVRALKGRNEGTKILMIDEGIWFNSPNSANAIRITPLQRATGEASYGDIAKIRWAFDYTVEKIEEIGKYEDELYTRLRGRGEENLRVLSLKTAKKNNTYQEIVLYTTAEYQPLYAELYLRSGKLFKVISFGELEEDPRGAYIKEINYIDILNPQKITVSRIESVEFSDSLTDRYFNQRTFVRIP